MYKQYIDDNIYMIENFISQEDLDDILIDFKNKENWKKVGNFYQKTSSTYNEKTKKVLEKYKPIVEELINDEFNMVNWQDILQKFIPDNISEWAIPPHADRFDYEELGAGEKQSKYVTKGYIIYFNDDYTGGEILYINKNISIKPKPGMILVHPGDEEYKHGVKAVESGERYLVTGFVYEKDFFEKNKGVNNAI